ISKLLAPPVQLAPEKGRALHLSNSQLKPRHVYRSIRIGRIFEDRREVRYRFVTAATLWRRYHVFARPRFNLGTAFFRQHLVDHRDHPAMVVKKVFSRSIRRGPEDTVLTPRLVPVPVSSIHRSSRRAPVQRAQTTLLFRRQRRPVVAHIVEENVIEPMITA